VSEWFEKNRIKNNKNLIHEKLTYKKFNIISNDKFQDIRVLLHKNIYVKERKKI